MYLDNVTSPIAPAFRAGNSQKFCHFFSTLFQAYPSNTSMNKKQRRMKQKRQRVHDQKHVQQSQIHGHISPVHAVARNKANPNQSIPLWTKTGELFQPVRLYYRIRNLRKLRMRLAILHCIRQAADDNHWSWLYAGETLGMTFEKAPSGGKNPIELGTLFVWGENGMALEVHSIERALAAMTFFDHHLPRRFARLTHVSIVNYLFDPQHVHTFQFPFCAASDAQTDDPVMTLFRHVDRLKKRRRSARERDKAVAAYLQTLPTSTFPHTEHLALRFSRKRLQHIRFVLESRQYVAIQRWKGNDHFTPVDYVLTLIHAESSTETGK